MDLKQKIFSESEVKEILHKLTIAEKKNLIQKRTENNTSLLDSYSGTGPISEKWNIKIYKFNIKKNGYSVVCNDIHTLEKLINENYKEPDEELKLLKIDDAGWGFPLCGVMIGVTDETKVYTDIVPVEYFQGNKFEKRHYLDIYSKKGINILKKIHAKPETHRIEICTGFVNSKLKDDLRNLGYDVRVTEIKGLLQDELENEFKKYVIREINHDLYFDPKEHPTNKIGYFFRKALQYGQKNCPEKIKNGWQCIKGNKK